MKLVYTLGFAAVLWSCNQKKTDTPKVEEKIEAAVSVKETKVNVHPFTAAVEKAHNTVAFKSKKAVQYDIDLVYGGKQAMDATITQSTDGTKIKITHKNGKIVGYDGEEVFAVTKDSLSGRERFSIFTWTYFFAFPHKLTDPGTQWSSMSKSNWGGAQYDAAKLTFDNGIGDTPKDWYLSYKNPETDMLEGAAYIVSFGKDVAKAEENPHAVKYANFVTVDEVPFATTFTINNWNKEQGYLDELGVAKIKNIKFVEPTEGFFSKPETAILVKMPTN